MKDVNTESEFVRRILSGDKSAAESPKLNTDKSRVIAFYLPQFHRIPENSQWWSPGFTEWTNVARARPNFVGHHQPHIPRELGFYDLTNPGIFQEQIEMASAHGIEAFCFHHYWFSGRRILERPAEDFMRQLHHFKFCLSWANENWTRTWDGDNNSVLLEQKYGENDPEAFIDSIAHYLRDERYLCINGRPLLIIYRAAAIPNCASVVARWKAQAKAVVGKELHVCAVDFYDVESPQPLGVDALIEFPPHKFNHPGNIPDSVPTITNREFTGGIIDYGKVVMQSMLRRKPEFTLYRSCIPSWDNTARRQNNPLTVIGSTPNRFEHWLKYLRAYNRTFFADPEERLIFINAWNEWGEGCHLEPDLENGLEYLKAIKNSELFYVNESFIQIRDSFAAVPLKASLPEASSPSSALEIDAMIVNLHRKQRLTNWLGRSAQKYSKSLSGLPLIYRATRYIYRTFMAAMRR
jgi:Glycosyltransferase WbsX